MNALKFYKIMMAIVALASGNAIARPSDQLLKVGIVRMAGKNGAQTRILIRETGASKVLFRGSLSTMPEKNVPSESRFELMGTIGSTPPIAVIRDNSRTSPLVGKAGERISPDVQLLSVHDRHVTLMWNEKLVVATYPGETAHVFATKDEGPALPPEARQQVEIIRATFLREFPELASPHNAAVWRDAIFSKDISRVGDKVIVSKAMARRLKRPLGLQYLAAGSRTSVKPQVDGSIKVAFDDVAKDSPLEVLGVEAGDALTTVNGRRFRPTENLRGAVEDGIHRGQLELEFERDGDTRTLQVQIDETSEEADLASESLSALSAQE